MGRCAPVKDGSQKVLDFDLLKKKNQHDNPANDSTETVACNRRRTICGYPQTESRLTIAVALLRLLEPSDLLKIILDK